MATHENVAKAWKDGKTAHSNTGNYSDYPYMSTDGKNLYRYNMLIGRTLEDGTKQALNVTGPYKYSTTTSKHVNYAKKYADEIVTPVKRDKWYYFPENMAHTLTVYRHGWKTYMGAYSNKPESLIYWVTDIDKNYNSDYAIVYWQYIGKTGHVVTYHEWLSDFTTLEIEKRKQNKLT